MKTYKVDLNDVDGRGFFKVRGVEGVQAGEIIEAFDPDDGTKLTGRLVEILADLNIAFAEPVFASLDVEDFSSGIAVNEFVRLVRVGDFGAVVLAS